jgi:hypothetical protein
MLAPEESAFFGLMFLPFLLIAAFVWTNKKIFEILVFVSKLLS